MGQPGGADRSIKAQLNRIVLIPSVTFLVLFTVLSTATLLQAVSLRVATGDGRSGVYLYYAVAELQKERRLAVEHLSAPSADSLRALREQAATTDTAVDDVESRDTGLRGRGDPEVGRIAEDFFTALGERDDVRGRVMAEDGDSTSVDTAMAEYNDIIARGIRLYDAMGRRLDDGPSVAAAGDAVDLMRAQDLLTRADALLSGAAAAGQLSHRQQVTFASLVTDARSRLRAGAPALRGEPARAHERLTRGSGWERLIAEAERVAEQPPEVEVDPASGEGRPVHAPPEDMSGWRSAADQVNSDLTTLTDTQARAVTSATNAASTWMFTLALGGGIIALFAGTVAYGVASRSAARLTTRLARLRGDTLNLAREELPRIVRRLANGDPVDLDTELKQLDHGTDEVGQVADAFNTAQRTAVQAAVTQADMRAGVNRVFLGIAHRNQSLVQRQLQLLDRVEREEEDPDLLEDLFHLDHLATRGRRNAENLIILGGAQPGRRWRNPIPLVDILRGAISETEEYARVKLRVVPDLSLVGTVVADIIHLVAELVENATSFSPPHTLVHINSEVVPKGVVVEIEDRGLGMSEEGLAAANRTLGQAPEFDVMALNHDSRLGLFVVARLAAKHEVSVQLCPSPYGGTRAVILLPAALISSGEVPVRRRPEPSGQDAAPDPPMPDRGNGGDLLAAQRGIGRPLNGAHGGPAVPDGATTPHRGGGRPVEDERGPDPDEPRPERADTGPHPAPAANGTPPTNNGTGHPSADRPPDGHGSAPPDGETRPPLPRRRRQASLAPQLRHPAPREGAADRGPDQARSAEDARQMMNAFQAGTRRGRDGAPDGTDNGAAPASPEPRTRPAQAMGARDRNEGRPAGDHTGESE